MSNTNSNQTGSRVIVGFAVDVSESMKQSLLTKNRQALLIRE